MKQLSTEELTALVGGSKRSFRHGWTGRSYMFLANRHVKPAFGRWFMKGLRK